MVVLYAGDNDLAAGKTPQQVIEDYKAFVARVRRDLPKAKIAFISIKPSPASAPNRLPRISPGRVEIFNTTLKALIRMAYSRFAFDTREIIGGPSWVDSERFDIVATMERPPQTDATGMPTELVGMLRALLEDRFRVKTHYERRDGDVYTLTFARSDRKTAAGLRTVPEACAAATKDRFISCR